MSHIPVLLTPRRTPTPRRPPKKEHKAEGRDTDYKGVGVIGEVTPDSCSTSDDRRLMRANTATRQERSLSSGPYTHLEHGSSEQAEDAQSQPQLQGCAV